MAWHEAYDDESSSFRLRLQIVQRQFSHLLEIAPPGRISLVSVCAGQGRDVLPVLAKSERRGDVEARLVEIDPENATIAVRRAAALGLETSSFHNLMQRFWPTTPMLSLPTSWCFAVSSGTRPMAGSRSSSGDFRSFAHRTQR